MNHIALVISGLDRLGNAERLVLLLAGIHAASLWEPLNKSKF